MKTGDRASFLVMPSPPDPMRELVEAAREEGQLTVIGCPRDWSGYGEIIDSFTSRYGLKVNEVFPQASSLDEVDTIRQARDNPSALSPDVVEIGQSFAPEARRDGLLQPYRVSTWETLADTARDPDGFWYAGGSGTIVFEVNLDVVEKVPVDWADLAGAEFRSAVALPGDRTSEQAGRAIFAAGLSLGGGNTERAAEEGLRFVSALNRKGNFVPSIGDLASLADGRTPILMRWDYLARNDRARLRGKTRIGIFRPRTGIVAGSYVRAISASAPHPNAARLWMEHLCSHQTRHAGAMQAQYRVWEHPELYFPTIQEQEKAREIIIRGWDSIVGVKIECCCRRDDGFSDTPMSFNQSDEDPPSQS